MNPRALFLALALAACGTGDIGSVPRTEEPAPEPEPEAFDITTLDAAATHAYLSKIAPPLVGRVLSPAENAQIDAEGGAAIDPILRAWQTEPALVQAARVMMEEKLSVSGQGADVDYALPGNLVEHVVASDLPWSEILTATSCYDAEGAPIECDSGAPFTAGVLTTRGFLKSRASRFNLTRSSTLMRAFACQVYPQEETLQPKVPLDQLKPMFAITDLSEANAEDVAAAVNTGCACNDCHGQFAAHAQLFVKFDEEGLYRPEATGLQDPEGELGRSTDGLMASHFEVESVAASEASQLFGTPVANLAEAGRALAEHPIFLQCAAQNVLEYTLRIDTAGPLGKAVSSDMLEAIAARAEEDHLDPTFPEIVHAVFTDADVVRTTLLTATIHGESDEEP
ncbi:MAG: hypothetical protein JNL21_18775 [Myxococcales bacterium]|nr:hypothetical protein [Myxococcales bacterium]